MDAYQAGQQLGSLLFGQQPSAGNPDGSPSLYDAVTGNAPKGGTYYRTLATGGRAYEALADARKARAQAMISDDELSHRRAITPEQFGALGYSPDVSALVENIVRANPTLNLSNVGKFTPNYVAGAKGALGDLAAGNIPGYNQNTALATGKQYQPVIVSGQTMIPNGVPLGDAAFTAQATPSGQAAIGANNALGNARNAHAGLYTAQATDPAAFHAGRGSSGAGAKASAPTAAILSALGAVPEDPASMVRALLRYRNAVNAGASTPVDIMNWGVSHPITGTPVLAPDDGSGAPPATGVNFISPPQRPALGDAAIGPPAPGTVVRTDSGDVLGSAAARAIASVDPTASLQPSDRTKFSSDPRVLTLQQQATRAITTLRADPARVAAKLQQEYAAIGYGHG